MKLIDTSSAVDDIICEQEDELTRLREELAEAQQATNSNKAAYTMAYERLTEYEARADKAEAQVAELEEDRARYITAFKHTHVASYNAETLNDKCGKCGLDLRDPVHSRFSTDAAKQQTSLQTSDEEE